MVVRLARPDVAGTVLLTVSWFQAVCRSRSACSPGAGGGLALRAGRRAPSAAHPLAGAARNSSGGCREQHEVCCSWWSFPGLASFALSRMVRRRPGGCRCLLRSRLSCRRSSAAPCTRRRTGSALAGAMRAPAGAIPTGEAKDLYVFPLRRDVGCGIVRRFLWRGSCGRRWSAQELRSIYQRRFPARAGAPHRLGAVRDFAGLRTGTVRLRRRTTTQKELEQHGRTGTSRSSNRPCTGCCRTPTRDGSRMLCGAGRSRAWRSATRSRSTASASAAPTAPARIITRQSRWHGTGMPVSILNYSSALPGASNSRNPENGQPNTP